MHKYYIMFYIIQNEREIPMTQAKSFLKEIDFTKQELEELIDLSIKFKQLKKERIPHKYLDGLNIALIFEKHLQEPAQLLQWLVRT